MNAVRVQLQDVCTFERGALQSIDLAKLYMHSDPERRESVPFSTSLASRHRNLVTLKSQPILVLSGLMRQLLRGSGPASLSLSRVSEVGPVRFLKSGAAPAVAQAVSQPPLQTGKAAKLRRLQSQRYTVEKSRESRLRVTTEGVIDELGRLEIDLPFGMPRFINVRTLKAMLGARRQDILFHKVGEQWEICPETFEVDLRDRSQVFRLGEVQVYS